MNKIKIALAAIALGMTGVACNSLDVEPSTELKVGVKDVASAQAALIGVYDGMQSSGMYGQTLTVFGDLRGGDMQPTSSGDSRTHPLYSFNNRTPDNGPGGLWSGSYSLLNRVNAIITAFDAGAVTDGEEAVRNDILAQAYALRALLHFNIVRLYGVPYAKDNGASWGAILVDKVVAVTEHPARSTVAQTYEMIEADLTKALGLYNTTVSIADDFGMMNYWAAKALTARVALYQGNWDEAYTRAVDVIENSPYKLVATADYLNSWGQTYTSESIFSVINTTTDNPSREALSNLSSPIGYGEIVLSDNIIEMLREYDDENGENGDIRAGLIGKDKTDADGWCKKYPGREGDIFTNNVPVFRLSELYLIAAEAALKKSTRDQTNADKYLNAIRTRANTPAAIATNDLVINERRKELVHEGHRFFDILRQGLTVERTGGRNFLNPGEVITVTWDDYLTVLPIPRGEINGNPEIQPNPGYIH